MSLYNPKWIGLAMAMMAAGSGSQALAQSTGSPARAAQDIFNTTVTDRYYFERMFPRELRAAKGDYANALRFSSCATTQSDSTVRAVVATDAGSAEERTAIAGLVAHHRQCIMSRVALSPALLRGALAEALWKKDGSVTNPGHKTSIDMSEIEAFYAAAPHGDAATRIGNMPVGWIARCQAAAIPDGAAKLIRTIPGTADEKTAAADLYARSEVCGVTSLGPLPVEIARANLADALYQNVHRYRTATAAKP